jgi:hypothetical protein
MRRTGAVAAVLFLIAGACATTGISGTPSPAENAAADRLRARLTGARAALGLSAAAPFIAAEPYLDAIRRSIARGRNITNAIDYQLQSAANDSERDIRLMWDEVDDLERLRFRGGLVRWPLLNVAIAVVDRGAPSIDGRYLVLFAVASHGLQLGDQP